MGKEGVGDTFVVKIMTKIHFEKRTSVHDILEETSSTRKNSTLKEKTNEQNVL